MCPKEVSVRPKLSMGLLEAGCLLEDSHSQLGLASIKDISLECFFNENVSRRQLPSCVIAAGLQSSDGLENRHCQGLHLGKSLRSEMEL